MARKDIRVPLDRQNRNNHNDNYTQLFEGVQQVKKTIDDLVLESGGDSNLEVVQARGGESTLNSRLDKLDDKDNELTSQLAEKANQSQVNQLDRDKVDKSYVDNLFENLGTLEIKGSYGSVSDLNNAYPNGTSGLYEVGGELYAWNGNEWKSVFTLEVMPWADFLTEQDEEWVV